MFRRSCAALPLGSDGGSASGCGTTRVYAGRFQASPWPASRRAGVSVYRYSILIAGRKWGYYNVQMRIAPPPLPSADRIERKRRESHLHADRRRPRRQRPASRTSGSAPPMAPGSLPRPAHGDDYPTYSRPAAIRHQSQAPSTMRVAWAPAASSPGVAAAGAPAVDRRWHCFESAALGDDRMPPADARCYSTAWRKDVPPTQGVDRVEARAVERSRDLRGADRPRTGDSSRLRPATGAGSRPTPRKRDAALPALGRSATSASRYLWPRYQKREPDQFVP